MGMCGRSRLPALSGDLANCLILQGNFPVDNLASRKDTGFTVELMESTNGHEVHQESRQEG